MADNVAITAGTGTNIATDDVSGVQYQRIKIDLGGDGVAAPLSSANPLPVSDAGASLTVDGTVAATQSGTWNVTNVSGVVSLPTGAATAAKQPALGTAGTAATDVITVQGIASGTAQNVTLSGTNNIATVSTVTAVTTVAAVTAITNALPVGSNAIGKLAPNSGVDIGDVDVTTVGTITPGTAAANLGKAADAVAGATDTGVATLAVRDDALTTLTPVDGDYVPLRTTAKGAVWTSDVSGDDFLVTAVQSVTSLVASTDVSVLAAAGASIRNYITDVDVVNTSGLATVVHIYSGDPDSAGVLLVSVPVGDSGVCKSFTTPRKGAANTAIFAEAIGGACTLSIGGFTSTAG